MTGYAIIPDIHADLNRLTTSLKHVMPDEKILFLGDFIDAGLNVSEPQDLLVLETVRDLILSGKATGVMGNHELNAILFHTDPPLRAHSSKNLKQHRSFLDQFGVATSSARNWTDWFLRTLPLWHEADGLRVVHACWSKKMISEIKLRRPDGYLHYEDLEEIAYESTAFGRAVKVLTSGPEAKLPHPYMFHDYHGNPRTEVRLAWWKAGARTWPEATLSVPDQLELPSSELPLDVISEIYDEDAPPVLVGHYKMAGDPQIGHPKASSIDFPDQACLYKWRGELQLTGDNLIIAD